MWRNIMVRLLSLVEGMDWVDWIAKSALSGKEKNDYELEKLGAVRKQKGHIPMKIMKKMEASKAKRERQQRRFVSEREESDS